jgi:prefoldin subunit 5
MLQKLNLIMNQTLPATYDDSLSYYEALSKICYEVNEIIDKINADEALIAANSEAITSINSQITSINNSLEADAEKIQQHTTQINGLLQSMQQLATQVNDLDGDVSSLGSSVSSLTTRVNSIESDFNTGFTTPYVTITSEILPGSPSDRAATKAYVDSKLSSEFTPIVLTGNGGPAVLTQITVRFDKTGLIIYGSISQDELPSGGYEVFTSSTLNTLANGISAWVGDALANRTILVPIFKQASNLDSPSFDSKRWFSLSFNSSGVLSALTYVKGSGASTTAPNFVAQTVI